MVTSTLEFPMTIGGAAAPITATFPVENPATYEVVAEAPDCTREQLDRAMNAAQRAFPDWRRDEGRRRQALLEAAAQLEASAGLLAPVLTAEQGKPLRDAHGEVGFAALWLRYYAKLEIPPQVIKDTPLHSIEVRRRPIGVVAAITPWNYPLVSPMWKIGPALLTGNTVVLKPSPYTPLTVLLMGRLLGEVLPAGVLNVVSGGAELGEWMTTHPLARKVSFTGSVRTGQRVATAAAPDLKRVTLELGGNDPAIVLDDADVGTVAENLFWAAFTNCGQVCCGVKRLYVPERLHDDVVDALAATAGRVIVGPGTDETAQLGPINNRPQVAWVEELVGGAVRSGARPAAGGVRLDGPGNFYAPTILAGASDGMRIVDEEQFGPALPVVPYRDLDEVVDRVNRSSFGLGASVWSPDIERAAVLSATLDCGTVWLNAHAELRPDTPFGGLRSSGLGVENGVLGLDGYTDVQVLHTHR